LPKKETETVTISIKVPKEVYDYVKKYLDFTDESEEEFWREELLIDLEGLADTLGLAWGHEFQKTVQKHRDGRDQ